MKHLGIVLLSVLLLLSVPTLAGKRQARVPQPQPVMSDYFMRCVSGKGWQYVESHEIKANGDIEKRDYWDGHAVEAPVQYYFTRDSITTYMDFDAYPIMGYRRQRFAFDGVNNSLTAGGTEVFKVMAVSPDTLRFVKYQAMRGDGTPIYVYATYRAMKPDEAEACRANYRYDLDTFNERYPAVPVQERLTAEDFMRHAVGFGWKCTEMHKMEVAWRYDAEDCRGGGAQPAAEDYFISADSLTVYQPCGHGVLGMAGKVKYTYRANGYYVATGIDAGFRVLSLNDSEMRIVKRMPSADGTKPVSLYCVYRKMTGDELRRISGTVATAHDGMELSMSTGLREAY